MGPSNAIAHYGKPVVGIVLAWAAIFGLALALGGEEFRASSSSWLAVLFVHWTIISYLVWLAFDFRTNAHSSPAVRLYRPDEGILLVDFKDWLGMNVAVLIYKQEADFERLLCPGSVINIQRNGLIQIGLVTSELNDEETEGLTKKLGDGNLGSLIVKPGLSTVI